MSLYRPYFAFSGSREIPIAAAIALGFLALPSTQAQPAKPKPAKAEPASKAAVPKAARKPVAPKVAEPVLPPASTEQIDAAERVFYGHYECEFKQTVQIAANPKHPAYVDVKHGKADYLMKPVLSSTGAIRLEDVRNETLMVQISSKSMLLNVRTGQRIIDDCITPKQRELVEAARAAKAEAAVAAVASVAASAASAASASLAASTTEAASAASAPPAASAPAPAASEAVAK